MDLEPVADTAALVMRGQKDWVCVADLHIGIEVELAAGGFRVPSQTDKMLEGLERLSSFGDGLLLLGDVKHTIPYVGRREDREIRPFLARLHSLFGRVMIIAGNHDGGLASAVPEGIEAVPGHGTAVEDVGVFHGHVWPSREVMAAKRLVMGHIHPSVLTVDSIGTGTNEKCWVRGRLRKKAVLERYRSCPAELVVVPAFNPLMTGTPVNVRGGAKLGPLFRNELVEPKSIRVYLLDGTDLGNPPVVERKRRRAE